MNVSFRYRAIALKTNNRLKAVGAYAGAVALCLLLLFFALRLWRADLHVPFSYGLDGLFYSVLIKGVLDNGWFLHNKFIGMPGGLDLSGFPMSGDNLHFLFIRLIGLFSADYALVLNLFYLFTFPLATITTLYVLRQFRISYPVAIFGGLLYAFLPYHFFRGEYHLFLSTYYTIPLITLVILWCCGGEVFIEADARNHPRLKLSLRKFKTIFSLSVCLLMAITGVIYYTFFACYLLFAAGLFSAITRRRIIFLVAPFSLIGIIALGLAVNLAPTLLNAIHHQNNVAERQAVEAETYGLKITQLLLPSRVHRIPTLAELRGRYNLSPYVNGENDSATLGLVGTCGFLILIGWLLFMRRKAADCCLPPQDDERLDQLGYLNMAAVLLATVGGFGSLFALLISPQIRSYNRISIFIAFFSLFAVAILLDAFSQRYMRSKTRRAIFYAFLVIVCVLGILDQTSKSFVPDYVHLKAEYKIDGDFVRRIEALMPPGAMIFQFPYIAFPESPPVYRLADYELFRGYLHSKNLHWSYGALKGTDADLWQREIAVKPMGKMLEDLSFAGFSGIYLDRMAYTDNGAALEATLSGLLGTGPMISDNARLVFFDMRTFNAMIEGNYSKEQFADKKSTALNPLLFSWGGGFSDLEGTPDDNWRWCSFNGTLQIYNGLDRERKVLVEMNFATDYPDLSDLRIISPLIKQSVKVNSAGYAFSQTLIIPPGHYTIEFASNAKRVVAPSDPRSLVFKVRNFKYKEIE